jgi:hypothetical protein
VEVLSQSGAIGIVRNQEPRKLETARFTLYIGLLMSYIA